MSSPPQPTAGAPLPASHAPMGYGEFIGFVACLMALNALAVDSMLPALPEIAHSLGVTNPNHQQRVLTAYLVGFGAGQLFVGSVSDRFGRRPVLLWGLALYVLASFLCMAAPRFDVMLAARLAQGIASAVPRVITTSIVRDCYGGRKMASVMSLAMTIFMAVPVLAPGVGQVVIMIAPWRAVFGLLTAFGLIATVWVALRLPETLAPEYRRSIAPRALLQGFGSVLRTRESLGYMLAGGMMFGAMFSFLVSSQQIFTEIYKLGAWFPVAFASVAITMSFSSFLNSRLVGRFGMRLLCHIAVLVFVGVAIAGALAARAGVLTFVPFMLELGAIMFLTGMMFSNMNALAMEKQGHLAGTASSLVGTVTTMMAVTIGGTVGSLYDGTLVPLTTGQVACGSIAFLIMAVTERGRMFGRR